MQKYKFKLKLKKIISIITSIILVVAAMPMAAFDTSCLTVPGMAEMSGVVGQELEQRRELLNQVVRQLQSKNLPMYLRNIAEFLGHLKIAIKPDVFKFLLSWDDEDWRTELISVCAEFDEREFENETAKRIILHAKKISFYTEIAEKAIDFLEKHKENARKILLIGKDNVEEKVRSGLPDCTLHAYEVTRRLNKYGVDCELRAWRHKIINQKSIDQHIWIFTGDGYIIEAYPVSGPAGGRIKARVLHESEDIKREFVEQEYIAEAIREPSQDMEPWGIIAEKLESDDVDRGIVRSSAVMGKIQREEIVQKILKNLPESVVSVAGLIEYISVKFPLLLYDKTSDIEEKNLNELIRVCSALEEGDFENPDVKDIINEASQERIVFYREKIAKEASNFIKSNKKIFNKLGMETCKGHAFAVFRILRKYGIASRIFCYVDRITEGKGVYHYWVVTEDNYIIDAYTSQAVYTDKKGSIVILKSSNDKKRAYVGKELGETEEWQKKTMGQWLTFELAADRLERVIPGLTAGRSRINTNERDVKTSD